MICKSSTRNEIDLADMWADVRRGGRDAQRRNGAAIEKNERRALNLVDKRRRIAKLEKIRKIRHIFPGQQVMPTGSRLV